MLRWLFGQSSTSRAPAAASAKVLVCAVGEGFESDAGSDLQSYQAHFPAAKSLIFTDPDELFRVLPDYDVIHLHADFGGHGTGASGLSGQALIAAAASSGVKLLWIAAANPPDAYIEGFKVGKASINLIMTIERKGNAFSVFLSRLLSKLADGKSLPAAWVSIAPQAPAAQTDAPEMIFYAGRPKARF